MEEQNYTWSLKKLSEQPTAPRCRRTVRAKDVSEAYHKFLSLPQFTQRGLRIIYRGYEFIPVRLRNH